MSIPSSDLNQNHLDRWLNVLIPRLNSDFLIYSLSLLSVMKIEPLQSSAENRGGEKETRERVMSDSVEQLVSFRRKVL